MSRIETVNATTTCVLCNSTEVEDAGEHHQRTGHWPAFDLADHFPTVDTRIALAQLLTQHMSCHPVQDSSRPSCLLPATEVAPGATWIASHLADAVLRAEYREASESAEAGRAFATRLVDYGAADTDGARTAPEVTTADVAALLDVVLEAAQNSDTHTEECRRMGWSLLHLGEGACVCQRYTDEEIDDAARTLDTSDLWDRKFAPSAIDRREQYRNMLRSQVRAVLAAVARI